MKPVLSRMYSDFITKFHVAMARHVEGPCVSVRDVCCVCKQPQAIMCELCSCGLWAVQSCGGLTLTEAFRRIKWTKDNWSCPAVWRVSPMITHTHTHTHTHTANSWNILVVIQLAAGCLLLLSRAPFPLSGLFSLVQYFTVWSGKLWSGLLFHRRPYPYLVGRI